ncbi:MAG: dockerin type I repeat-containing protein [Ruminococcus sp.]|nr:dockerin type I repeat-containing protein [Ruminococcus sp.]
MKKQITKTLSLVLIFILLLQTFPITVFAKNSENATLIRNIYISDIRTPYVGECPDYSSKLAEPNAYTYSKQLEDDPEVFEGKWWTDKTTGRVMTPDDTFEKDHIYAINIILKVCDGYEFLVDNYNTPFINAYVNDKQATVYDSLTTQYGTFIEYTFEPCDYNYEISKVSVNVIEPVPGEYPVFDVEIETDGVTIGKINSPYYLEGIAWYDYKTYTFMNPSDTFEEDGIYEANIVLSVTDNYFFTTQNGKTSVEATVNGKKAESNSAGKDQKYFILVSCVFGDIREEVYYVEIKDIKEPAVGANPIFSAAPVGDKFNITGVFWTDITNTTEVNMKENDKFIAGHTYELQVWIRAKENYKFPTDEDGFIDIMALVGGHQAEVLLPGSEISAEISLVFTLSKETIISFADVMYVDAPIAGRTPDYDAFCSTKGCNVSAVEWYDVTDGRGVLMNEDDVFEEGREYSVVVRVDAEGNYTFETDDINVNIAEGNINGQNAIAYSSYDETYLELGLKFSPCERDLSKIVEEVEIYGIGEPYEGNSPYYNPFCITPGCEIIDVEWFDVTDGTMTPISADTTFKTSNIYSVVITVEALYEYTFLMEDGYNEAIGYIDGRNAIEYGSHDEKIIELGYVFEPCEDNPEITPIGILGDVNADNKVDINDVTTIQKHLAELTVLTDEEIILADATQDDEINIKDVTAIQKYIADIAIRLPIGSTVYE